MRVVMKMNQEPLALKELPTLRELRTLEARELPTLEGPRALEERPMSDEEEPANNDSCLLPWFSALST